MITSHLDSHKFKSLLAPFKNISLITGKSELLFSKDADPFKTTTSRLVLFQMAKKYLPPKPGDLFIANDPENGGTQFNRIFFITCFNPQLYAVWDAELSFIDFKIPLTPLIEKGQKNPVIWSALVESHPLAEKLSHFIATEQQKIKTLDMFKPFIDRISNETYQKKWFNITKSLFEDHFSLKAYGQSGLQFIYREKPIKLSLLADEKQNVKTIQVDYSGTALADQFSCASHVVESGMIVELIKFYKLESYLSQPLLDHIKLILPPKSVVSKNTPTGEYNFELQKLTRQLIRHNLQQINTPTKKGDKKISVYSTAYLSLHTADLNYSSFLSNSRIDFETSELFEKIQFNSIGKEHKATLRYKLKTPAHLKIYSVKSVDDQSHRWIKLNKSQISHGLYTLKEGDEIQFEWKL